MKPLFTSKSPNTTLFPPSPRQTQPPLRIADILLAGSNEDHDDIFDGHALMDRSGECPRRSIDCYSPRRILARWFSGLRRSRVKRVLAESVRREEQKIEHDEKGFGDQTVQASCSMNGNNSGESGSSASMTHLFGKFTNLTSFNMGVGCCLLYLIAASKNELHKMMEMRMQMETLLVNNREELLKRDELSNRSEPNDILAYSAIDDQEAQILPESSTVTVCDQSFKCCQTPERDECLEGMGHLEDELEAELERLQLQLDSEKERLMIKVADGNTAFSKSQAMSYGEVIDPPPQEADFACGVPPDELERKLHELLEARQHEQIRELECALECLKQKLHEKEAEVAWWKDTERFITQHATDLSRFAS